MNIYEDERLKKQFRTVTDQIGYLLLDLIVVSLMKVNAENLIFKEFEEQGLIRLLTIQNVKSKETVGENTSTVSIVMSTE